MGVIRAIRANKNSVPDRMGDISQCVQVEEGLNGSKINFYTRHYTCKDDIHRCCEFVIETQTDFSQVTKVWIVFIIFLLCLSGCLKHFATTTLCITGFFVVFAVFKIYFYVNKESVLVEMQMLGIQQTVTYWLGWKETEILHKEDIVDVVINEAVTMGQVIFYLAVIMKDRSLKPLFLHSKPRLKCLKKIYEQIQINLSNQSELSEVQTTFFNTSTKRENHYTVSCR